MNSRSGTPGPASSRLPTKKNSFHSLRDAKENININQRALATSPTALSDTSSVSDTAGFNAAAAAYNNGNINGLGYDSRRASSSLGFYSRRSSTSSQQSDSRGRTSNGWPSQTRIPRLSPGPSATKPTRAPTATAATTTPSAASHRRPLSIRDAFKMAEEEEAAAVAAAAQGSPSPAPRPWRNRSGGGGVNVKGTPTPSTSEIAAARAMSASESRMQKIMSHSPLDVGGRRTARRIGEPPTPTADRAGNTTPHQVTHQRGPSDEGMQIPSSVSTPAGRSSGGPDIRRIRYEEDQARLMVAMGERSGGLFSPKARVSPKVAGTGRELNRRASNSSLSEKSRVPVSTSSTSPRPTHTSTRSLLNSTASSRARTGSVIKRSSTGPAEPVASRLPPRSKSSLTGRTSVASMAARTSLGAASETASNADDRSVASPSPVPRSPMSPVPRSPMSPVPRSPMSPVPRSPMSPRRHSVAAPVQLSANRAEPELISSPGKSFGWNTDDDFTSDSLMVSNSPPLHTQPESPVSHTPAGNPPQPMGLGSPDLRPRNTKLDEIRRLEIEASLQFPDDGSSVERSSSNGEHVPVNHAPDVSDKPEDESAIQRRASLPAERQNKAIDEIRARENEGLSKRAISAAKLDEIRQRNAEFRMASVDTQALPLEQPQEDKDAVVARVRARSVFEKGVGAHALDARAAIVRTHSLDHGQNGQNGQMLPDIDDNNSTASSDRDAAKSKSAGHSRTESQELLRKLARVTTSVAAVERQDLAKDPLGARRLRGWFSSENLIDGGSDDRIVESIDDIIDSKIDEIIDTKIDDIIDTKTDGKSPLRLPRLRDADTLRPTVGFAQLAAATTTTAAKRSSVAQSDGDPLDRIEAEMKLFAAHGDQSERGSIRALSPDTDGDSGSKGAPAPSKLSMAHGVDDATPKAAKTVDLLVQATPRVTGAYVETPMSVRTKADAEGEAEGKEATNGTATNTNGVHARARSMSRPRSMPRSRSASRPRALVNSAKPASARDDLLSIQRDQHMDDSTLDDFDTILAKGASKEADATEATDATDADRLRRMSVSINTYINDVQTAKKGIERLEDRVAHPKAEAEKPKTEKPEKATAEILATAISGTMEDFDKEITAALNRHEAERKLLMANISKEETDVSDVDSIAPAPVVTKRKTHQRQSSSVSEKTKEVKEVKEVKESKAAAVEKESAIPTITVTAPADVHAPVVSYLAIPLPKLYRAEVHEEGGNNNTTTKKRLTLFGIVVLLVSVWFAVETTTCAVYCRPETCQSGQACRWSPDDPSFGHAVPVKMDQWLTGGRGRELVAWARETAGDLVADVVDAATGTRLEQVDTTYFSFDEKRQHRRRLQKRGLVQPWTPSAETRSKMEGWRRAREAREQEAAAAAAEAVRKQTVQVHEGEEYDIFGEHSEDMGSQGSDKRGWW